MDFPKEKGVTVATTWGLRSSPPAERVWKAPRRRGSGQQSRTAASRLVPSAPLLPTDEGLPGRPATTGLWWGRLPEGPLEPAGMARAQGQRGRSTAGGEPAPSTLQPVAPPRPTPAPPGLTAAGVITWVGRVLGRQGEIPTCRRMGDEQSATTRPRLPDPAAPLSPRGMGRPLPEAPGQPSGASRPPAVAPGLPAARRPARRSPGAHVPGPGSWCACELLTEGGLACDLRPLYRAVTPRRRHSMATCRAAGPGSTSKWTRCCGCGRAPRTSTGEQDRRPCGAPASPATLGQGSDPGSAPVMVWEGHVGR